MHTKKRPLRGDLQTIALVLLVLLSAAFAASKNDKDTPWCAEQRAQCTKNCAAIPLSTNSTFECTDKGETNIAARAVTCVCLDAAGKVLSTSTSGGSQTVSTVPGSSSSSAFASGG